MRRPRAIVFLSTGCLACRQLAQHLHEVARTQPSFDYLVVISGDIATATQLANGSGLAKRITTWVDVGGVAAHSYQVAYTPFTYVVDEDSHVLIRGVANDWRGFESLLNEEGTLQAGKPWVPVSEPSPANR